MELTTGIGFCLIGLLTGLGIPRLSISLIEKKLALKNLLRKEGLLDRRWFGIAIAGINGFCWGGAGLFSQNGLIAFAVASLLTMALLFTIIDISIHIIPNELLLVTGALGVLLQLTVFGLKSLLLAIACMVVIFGIFLALGLIIGLHKIGAGDVKLAGIMGLVLGYPHVMYGILIMGIALMAYSLVGLAAGKLTHVSMFPFAPFLMLGMVGGMATIVFPSILSLLG